MPGGNIYGELYRAQFERQSADPTAGVVSRVIWNTTEGRAKYDNGSAYRAFLANDDKLVVGNNGTANTNVRINRSATSTLQLLLGGDSTAEGSASALANWGTLQSKLAGCSVSDYLDVVQAAIATNPASGSSRIFPKTDGRFYARDSSGGEGVLNGRFSTRRVITSSDTLLATDTHLDCDTTGGAITVTVPAAATSNTGQVVWIRKTDAVLNNVTLQTGISTSLSTEGECVQLQSNGSTWVVIQRVIPSKWVAFTPTGTFNNCTYTGFWKRIGDSIIVRWYLLFSAQPSTATLTDLDLPSGVGNIDTAKLLSTAQFKQVVGYGQIRDEGTSSISCVLTYKDTGSVQPLWVEGGASPDTRLQQWSDTSPFTIANTDTASFEATLPISGWNG